jgi:tetratricopeptide (TPR) repeat protein
MKSAIISAVLLSISTLGSAVAADSGEFQIYGSTDFPASGDPAAHEVFIRGLLQLHNFEYDDARATFLATREIDPNFAMTYWGEALTYENPLWNRFNTDASRAVLTGLGATTEVRTAKFQTEREKAYLNSIEALFSEGTQEERELRYSAALGEIHAAYPEDLDAAALYALSLLTISHGGRDFNLYMRSGAITEDILDINPRHPGALHYQIHSYDDPIHAPLGLRAAKVYSEVAPSAIHALHMGSHIYYALGMWDLGLERNNRSFEEAVARQPSPTDEYGNQAYHALTWVIYGLNQVGKSDEAAEKLALIEDQMSRFDGKMHRQNFIYGRASYLVDSGDWDNPVASVGVSYDGLDQFFVSTDHYVKGVLALKNDDIQGARAALDGIGGAESVSVGSRRAAVPRLLHLELAAQIELAGGDTDEAIALLEEAAALEASVPPEYGPAQPAQPAAELFADTLLAMGKNELARQNYELSLKSFVGRKRSLTGLEKASMAAEVTAN